MPLLAACGCGVTGKTRTSEASEFRSRGNKVCVSAARRAEQLKPASSGAVESVAFLEKADAVLARTQSELRALVPPPRLRLGYAAFLTAVSDETRRVGKLARDVRAHDAVRYRSTLEEMRTSLIAQQAQALGLRACAKVVEPRG